MKTTNLSKFLAIGVLGLCVIKPANAIETSAKHEIYNANEGSVYGLKVILNITATSQGKARKQEAQVWSNATCIGDRLLVASYTSINPNIEGNMPNIKLTQEIASLQLINAASEKFNAKLLLHDQDLGLAYIAIDPSAKNAANWKSQMIDISKDPELKHLDETINIFRFPSHLHYQSMVTLGRVSLILNKPLKLYQITATSMSAPSFNEAGEFIGITVAKPAEKGMPTPPVTIPAKYIRKLIKQATAKQAELTK